MENNVAEQSEAEAIKPESTPRAADKLKSTLRRVTESMLDPSRETTESLRESYERVLTALPPGRVKRVMERTHGAWQKAAGALGVGAMAGDIAIPVLFAAGSATVFRSKGSLKGAREVFSNIVTKNNIRQLLEINDSDNYAQRTWNLPEEKKHRRKLIAASAALGGGALAWGAGRPIERALTLAARGGGALGERVARRMDQIKNGDLTKQRSTVQT